MDLGFTLRKVREPAEEWDRGKYRKVTNTLIAFAREFAQQTEWRHRGHREMIAPYTCFQLQLLGFAYVDDVARALESLFIAHPGWWRQQIVDEFGKQPDA